MRSGDERSRPQRGVSESRKGASGPALRRSTDMASGVGRHEPRSDDAKQRQRSPQKGSASRRGQDDFVRQKTSTGRDNVVKQCTAPEESVRCRCGHVVPAKAKFCEMCGSAVRSDEVVCDPPTRSNYDARDYHDIADQDESQDEAQGGLAGWFYNDEGSQPSSDPSSPDDDDESSSCDDGGGNNGRRGGPSPGKPQNKQGFFGDFGGDPGRDNGFTFSHYVGDETLIYKDKDLPLALKFLTG